MPHARDDVNTRYMLTLLFIRVYYVEKSLGCLLQETLWTVLTEGVCLTAGELREVWLYEKAVLSADMQR